MITHSSTAVILSDHLNPSREPVVLAANATPAEIEAAAVAYFGEEIIRMPPDYIGFYGALLGSSVYQSVMAEPSTADQVKAMLAFVSAIQDCMAGRENRDAMQAAIWMLLSRVPLEQALAAKLASLMQQHHLAGVYQLQP